MFYYIIVKIINAIYIYLVYCLMLEILCILFKFYKCFKIIAI